MGHHEATVTLDIFCKHLRYPSTLREGVRVVGPGGFHFEKTPTKCWLGPPDPPATAWGFPTGTEEATFSRCFSTEKNHHTKRQQPTAADELEKFWGTFDFQQLRLSVGIGWTFSSCFLSLKCDGKIKIKKLVFVGGEKISPSWLLTKGLLMAEILDHLGCMKPYK